MKNRPLIAILLALCALVQVRPAAAQITSRTYTDFQGAYSASTAYAKGDIVTSGGATYISLVSANTNNTPASSGSYWAAIGSAGGGGSNVGELVVSGTLAAAVTSCGSATTTLLIAQGVTLGTTPLTVPINCTLLFQTGGEITGTGALTVNGAIQAANTQQVFASTITVAGLTGEVPVGWFGAVGNAAYSTTPGGTDDTAALNAATAALASGGTARLLPHVYKVSGTVTVPGSGSSLRGTPGPVFPTGSDLPSMILSTSSTAAIVQVAGASASAPLSNVTVSDLTMVRSVLPTSAAEGFDGNFCGACEVSDTISEESLVGYYLHSWAGGGQKVNRNDQAINGFLLSGYPSEAIDYFFLDSGDGNAENSIDLYNDGGSVGSGIGSATTIAFLLQGTAINDVDCDLCAMAGASHGLVINYTGTGALDSAADIRFDRTQFDQCGLDCVEINNMPASAMGGVTFDGGYFEGSPTASKIIDCENSAGVSFNDMQMGTQDTSADVVYFNGCSQFALRSNTFFTALSGSVGVLLNNSTNGTVMGNTIGGPTATLVGLTGTTHSVIAGNVLLGSATTGMSFDSASLNNQVLLNSIAATVTTAVSDASGSGYNSYPSSSGSTCPLSGSPTAPTAYSGAGTGATIATQTGFVQTNCNFTYALTAGSGSASGGVLWQFHFASAFANTPSCVATPVESNTAVGVGVWMNSNTTDTYLALGTGAALVSGTVYVWNIQCRVN